MLGEYKTTLQRTQDKLLDHVLLYKEEIEQIKDKVTEYALSEPALYAEILKAIITITDYHDYLRKDENV